ncbi:uncharacterized protein A4U43_C08F20190 [Asparagus officinalis]|nr:uncharacterized protein A4U43_C08F20190 [Asparagus officinalis]
MKSHSTASGHPPTVKRRWTCFSVIVPVIVFLSLIGTRSVLLGLHNRFPNGYNTEGSLPSVVRDFSILFY